MPAEKELARRIVLVMGAGSGIGREVAQVAVEEGNLVLGVDVALDPLLHVPVVTVVLEATVALEVDDVRGDAAVAKVVREMFDEVARFAR